MRVYIQRVVDEAPPLSDQRPRADARRGVGKLVLGCGSAVGCFVGHWWGHGDAGSSVVRACLEISVARRPTTGTVDCCYEHECQSPSSFRASP